MPTGGPIKCKHVCIVVERGLKLGQDLFIPIISKAHDIIESKNLALCNSLIEEGIIKFFKVLPIYILSWNYWSIGLP